MSQIASELMKELLREPNKLVHVKEASIVVCPHISGGSLDKIEVKLRKAKTANGAVRWIGMCDCGIGYWHN